MKKILSFFVLLAGMAYFTACSDNETLNPYAHQSTITVEKAEVTFDANGGIGSVQVSSLSAVSVSIPTEFQWLTASVAGNVINVTVEPNSGIEGRSAQLTIKNANDEVAVTVSQTGLVSRLSTYELEFSDEEGVQVVAFKHDVPVSVQSLSDWIAVQVDDENGRLLVGVASNDVEKSRMGLVAITSGDVKDTLVVFQKAFVFAIGKNSIAMTDAGGVQAIAINHSRPVMFETDVDWIACKLNTTGDSILVSVDKNEDPDRQGTVTVKSLEYTKTISVAQKGPEQGTESQPTFADEVYGQYMFVYYDAAGTKDWAYFDAEITEEGLTLYYPATATVILPYTVPLEIDKANRQVKAGPNGSFLGMYGSSYYIYLGWYNMSTGASGFGDSGMAIGTLSTEEEEGELTTYMDWGGMFGDNEIEGWMLQAFVEPEYSADYYGGALDYLIYPYMVKVEASEESAAARHRAPSARVINSRGHKVYPAKFNPNGLLKKMK